MPEPSNPVLPAKRLKIWRFSPLLLIALFLTVACAGDGGAALRVLAAASLTEAFNDVARAFEAENPEVTVALDFGGSQRLRSQLEFGAKADVFASADPAQMDLAVAAGVKPLREFWGIAKTLGTTGETLLVAAECGRPDVQMLTDVFHMYKGSGHHFGIEHFGAGRLGLIHVNDYPATPGRAEVTDADRVYPGDGLAPWKEIVAMLEGIGYEGMLSLELFNESYWAKGPATVAREGLEKLRRCVEG